MRIFNTQLLLLDIREGTQDLYVRAFSDYMGIIELIVKNANRGGTKRKQLLSKGSLIWATVYQRYRLYLTEFQVLERFYVKLNTASSMKLFETILLVLERGIIEPDYKLFKSVITQLRNITSTRELLVLLLQLTQVLGIVEWHQFRCSVCGTFVTKGITDFQGTTVCNKCAEKTLTKDDVQVSKLYPFDFSDISGLIDFIKELVGYNTSEAVYNIVSKLAEYDKDTRH